MDAQNWIAEIDSELAKHRSEMLVLLQEKRELLKPTVDEEADAVSMVEECASDCSLYDTVGDVE